MEPSEAIKVIREFQAWRRGGEQPMPYPQTTGEALDALCYHAERLERELEQIKATLANPHAVHLNMLRGTIQWTAANLRHLLGDP